MAIKFFKSIDLTHNELQNAKLHLTGTEPQADEGKIYFDTASDTVKVYVDYATATDVWETVAFQSWATDQFLEDSEVTTFAKSFSKTTASKKNFYRACEASEVKLLLSPHVINSKIA